MLSLKRKSKVNVDISLLFFPVVLPFVVNKYEYIFNTCIQVLSFDAFYTEEVTQRPSEPYRVRRCKVLFYLEDDSMQVVEPRDDNSGLSQGRLFLITQTRLWRKRRRRVASDKSGGIEAR